MIFKHQQYQLKYHFFNQKQMTNFLIISLNVIVMWFQCNYFIFKLVYEDQKNVCKHLVKNLI